MTLVVERPSFVEASEWPRFSAGGVKVDQYAVRVKQLCIPLAPERVPRVFVAVVAGANHLRVDLVDFGRALTLELETSRSARTRSSPPRPPATRVPSARHVASLLVWRKDRLPEDERS